MSTPLTFVKELEFEFDVLETVAPGVRRLIARNPGPFTHVGSGTFVIGQGRVAVIDPGPAQSEHIAALLRELGNEEISHILVTHTHTDHSPGVRELKARTGARTYGFGPHTHGRHELQDESVEAGADLEFTPDVRVSDGDVIEGDGFSIEALHTPGHCNNHLCFSYRERQALFSGDHVMGWSTTIIAPPDGDMDDYMKNLERLLLRNDARYYPTHGAAIEAPQRFVQGLIEHRQARERQILACLTQGIDRIEAMVPAMYAGTPELLYPAAQRSVFAHVLHLIDREQVASDGPATLTASYHLR